MATKTWKIGEYAKGGIIKAEVHPVDERVVVRAIDMDTKEVLESVIERDLPALQLYIEDNFTTAYYADKIMDWIKSQL